MKIYISTTDGEVVSSPDISATQADATLTRTGANRLTMAVSNNGNVYYSPAYIDDDTSLDDPGDQRGTYKAFNTESGGTQAFDTAVGGASRGASDYQWLNERPLDAADGWRHNGLTQVAETYGIENAATGDIDITGKTIIGHAAFCYAARSAIPPACTFRSATAGTGNSTTTGTLAIPSDVIAGDSLFVTVTSQGHTVSDALVTCTDDDSGGNTWTLVTNSTDRKAYLFWKRATSATASKTITVAGAITKLARNLCVMKDAYTGGTPYTNVSLETNASGDETHAGFTPDNDGSAIMFSIHDYGSNNAAASQSTANLGALTERAEHLPGAAGADAANSISTLDGSGAAAATGNITWAQTDSTTYSIAWAVRPEPGGSATAQLVRNGTDEPITLTETNTLFVKVVLSATYPAGVFGMKSTGSALDTLFLEGGVWVLYDESTASANDIEATGVLALTVTAILNALGSLAAAASQAFSITADLDATGALAAQGSIALTTAADLDAPGSLAASAALTFTPTAVLNAPGPLEASALIAFTTTADATAAIRDIEASAALAITASADLDATGSLAASAALAVSTTADLDATGTLASTAALAFTTSADLDAVGSIAAAATVAFTPVADLDATGTLAASATISLSATADATAAIHNIAAATTITVTATADLDALGTLAAATTVVFTSTADLTAPALNDIAATTSITFVASAALNAQGTLAAATAVALTAAADLDATGSLQATAGLAVTASADLDAAGSLIAAASLTFSTSADLNAPGSLVSAASLTFTTAAGLEAYGTLAAAAAVQFTTSANLTEQDEIDLDASAILALTASADLDAVGNLEASAAIAFTPAASLQGAVETSASAAIAFSTSASLTGAGELDADAEIAITGSVTLDATGNVTSVGLILFTASASITDANAGTLPTMNNPGATSGSPRRGVLSRSARYEVLKTN